MPEIYDSERGLKINLTDSDYEDYQNGNLSDDFYARRTDGSIANRVDISPLNDSDGNDRNRESSRGIDAGSAAIGALLMAVVAGVAYGVKKFCDKYKAKKTEAQTVKQNEVQVIVQKEESAQLSNEPACAVLSAETAKTNDAKQKPLTQSEAIQELMKIIVGMTEIADGKRKVTEGVENLSNAGMVERDVLLERLSDPKVLKEFNTYLGKNLQLAMQNEKILGDIFGRNLTVEGQYIPLSASDIEQQLSAEHIQD